MKYHMTRFERKHGIKIGTLIGRFNEGKLLHIIMVLGEPPKEERRRDTEVYGVTIYNARPNREVGEVGLYKTNIRNVYDLAYIRKLCGFRAGIHYCIY